MEIASSQAPRNDIGYNKILMAKLLLEDGKVFDGKLIGAKAKTFGEVVFNTSMTGYQEVLTDPSYAGQMITFTYPEIGNYGCNKSDYESDNCFASGIIIRNYSPLVSNYRSEETLDSFLQRHGVTGIYGLDTRALTRHIRDHGAMKAVICNDNELEQAQKELINFPTMNGRDLASEVTCKDSYKAAQKIVSEFYDSKKSQKDLKKVIALDFGVKQNILNKLIEVGCDVEVMPAQASAQDILNKNPDGIFLSNGPGDPEAVSYAIDTVKQLVEKYEKPIFGICLGHQILALANGAKTYKLKFGHRGANHPVKNLESEKIEIASHNHGFAVSKEGLPEHLEITHLNINDDTVAGIKMKNRDNVFSVQYHPEASPGPHDSDYLFKEFVSLM
jgi:carbamoyl-phosphate synthase small subunit